MNKKQVARLVLGAVSDTHLHNHEISAFKNFDFAGVTLFKRNVSDAIPKLTQSIRELIPHALIAIDQEGGRVSRLKGRVTDLGPAMDILETSCDAGSLKKMTEYGRKLSDELIALGINIDFAPVIDVLQNDNNNAIGDRCFGTNADTVQKRAGAFLLGLQESKKVMGCLKHFPGQGNAQADTHLESYSIQGSEQEIMTNDIAAFLPLLNNCPLLMMSHCIYPAFDSIQASLSSKVMEGLLRKKLGYQGLILSDDMNMKAIAQDEQGWKEAITEAVACGSNMVLVCEDIERSIIAAETLAIKSAGSKALTTKIENSLERLISLEKANLLC